MLLRSILVFSAILMLASVSAFATQIKPIPVTPGLWHSKVITSATGLQNDVIKEDSQCVDKTEYNPEEMVPAQEECKVSNVKQKSNYLEYDMTCAGGEKMPPVKAHVVLKHEKKSYEMTMDGVSEFQGQKFESKVQVVGTYKGKCKE